MAWILAESAAGRRDGGRGLVDLLEHGLSCLASVHQTADSE